MANDIALLAEAVYALRENFQTVAVDRGINFDKEAGFALQILGGSDLMMGVAMSNRQAVENAITNVAAIGISLNPAKKQAYLVPRKTKGVMMICLDISYMGLIDLAVASGSILWAQANIVREHDNFIVNGYDKPPTHGHDPFAGAEARGKIKGAYVVVKTVDGEYLTHTMDIESIYAVRDRSEAWKSFKDGKAKSAGPWASDEGEMIKKTVVKQAYKYWPKTDRSSRVDQAIHHLNTEGGEGFEPINSNGSKKYPADSLNEWIKQANAATSEVELSTVWQKGVAAMKPSKDLDAYNAFKSIVVSRGDVLKKQTVTDVTPKAAKQPVKTFDEVMAMICGAINEDDLNACGVHIDALPADHHAVLNGKYEEVLATLREAA
jgi:recombination protein RecT